MSEEPKELSQLERSLLIKSVFTRHIPKSSKYEHCVSISYLVGFVPYHVQIYGFAKGRPKAKYLHVCRVDTYTGYEVFEVEKIHYVKPENVKTWLTQIKAWLDQERKKQLNYEL